MNTNHKFERGIITFFDLEQFGLYQILKGKPPKLIEANIQSVFSGLMKWFSSRSVEQSVPWGVDNNRRTKAFCKNLSHDANTGDYMFVIWKTLGDSKGDIQGIEANSLIDGTSDNVISASDTTKDGKKYIWGLPCYYWVIPEYNKVASIRFPSSYADTDLFCQYVKAYVDYRHEDSCKVVHDVEIPRKDRSEPSKFKRVYFKRGKHSLTFKVRAKQTRKITKGANIAELCKKITHIVYHDVIETNVPDTRADWQKLFDKVGGIFAASSPMLSKKHKVELLVEGQPTVEEFEKLIEDYLEDYDPIEDETDETGEIKTITEDKKKDQARIGFKVNGKSGATTWLDEYVLRHEIHTSLGSRNKHYSSSYLLSIVNNHRNDLIEYLKSEQDQTESKEDKKDDLSYTEAGNDGEEHSKELGA
ncbi:hypothetical protein [Pluralibacter gergoviae]|uniref:hypothetical protein n=1 Tax=Pluralibacter gergoviae TaxID=61647 RepID=UPI00290D199B|nr:hypothetical protein [Pluralibacter gergoviae]MDU4002705.1 hypothetical protein [Pluralibacter gergoviae]